MSSAQYLGDAARVQKLSRLVEVSLVINSTLDLEPLLRYIMDTAAEITGSQSASILLIDAKTQELHFMAFNTEDDAVQSHLKRIPVPLNDSIAGAVVLENRPIVLDDVNTHPRHFRKADDSSGFQTYSLLGIPMRIKDRVIGVLEAVNKIGDGWTEDDQTYLEILASQAAVAIENASLITRLRTAYHELSQLDKMKNDFIAIASHELRTPLSVILGYASFLKDEAQGEASEHAEAVLNSALRMRQLIEDMTNLRYLKIGEGELERTVVPVVDMMMMAAGDVQSMAEANGHRLEYATPGYDLALKVDKGKIVMALTNILNNAIKFTSKSGTIRFGCQTHDNEVWLVVQDEGIGIPKDQYERIFEEFYQVADHMTRKHNGMGLGLAIAKAVIQAHRGRIWVQSAGENKGSTFYISLPLS